jgi:multiple antibiotic resistance protein
MDTYIDALKLMPTIFVALFPLVNPIGTALVLYGMTGRVEARIWRSASRKIALYSFLLLSFFFLFGAYVLKFFGVSVPIVQLSGGLVVASIGWDLLRQNDTDRASPGDQVMVTSESLAYKLFYPYTFPTTVGPGSLAVAMTFGANVDRGTPFLATMQRLGALAGILAIAVVTGACYARLKWVTEKVSPTGAQALSKIFAFFVFSIGVGIAWAGWRALNR